MTPLSAFWVYNQQIKVLKISFLIDCLYRLITALARCLHVLIPIKMLVEMDTWRSLLTFTYSSVLSEIVIAGRFLSKLYTWDIWLVDSNIIIVFFELSARWESLDQQLTVLSVEFSSFAHLCSSGAGQLEFYCSMDNRKTSLSTIHECSVVSILKWTNQGSGDDLQIGNIEVIN